VQPSQGPTGEADEPPPASSMSSIQRLSASATRRGEELLERFGDRPVIELPLAVVLHDRSIAGSVVGSALAFRIFLFFVPFLVLLVGLVGLVTAQVDMETINEQMGVSGALAAQLRNLSTQSATASWVAVALGLGGMATTGRSLTKVLVAASSLAWGLPVRAKAPVRVVGAVVGLVAGLGLCSVLLSRIRAEFGLTAASLSFLGVFAVYLGVLTIVLVLLPRTAPDPSAVLPGAALVSVTLVGMQAVSQLYLPGRIGRASEVYGAVGVAVVSLGWFFFMGRALALAMALNVVLFERFGALGSAVFSLPVLRTLPPKSSLVRRFLGQEDPPAGSA
jgi:uncharacterized BrkB/YihY/UPF0761 family membrane protein